MTHPSSNPKLSIVKAAYIKSDRFIYVVVLNGERRIWIIGCSLFYAKINPKDQLNPVSDNGIVNYIKSTYGRLVQLPHPDLGEQDEKEFQECIKRTIEEINGEEIFPPWALELPFEIEDGYGLAPWEKEYVED